MDSLPHDLDLTPVETLTDKAYRALEEEIVTLRIPPGTVVSEAILAGAWGSGERRCGRRCSDWRGNGWW